MSDLDSDRYYDGGIIPNELTDRERKDRDEQEAREHVKAELEDAQGCLKQAADSVTAAAVWERQARISCCLWGARGHLLVADRQSSASDDAIVLGHIREALALLEVALQRLESL